jgi:hypothetical protein
MQGSNEGCGWCFLSQSHVIMCWRWVTMGGVCPGDPEDCLCRLEPWVCLFVCLSRLGGSGLSSDRVTITQCGIMDYSGERAPDRHGMLRYATHAVYRTAELPSLLSSGTASRPAMWNALSGQVGSASLRVVPCINGRASLSGGRPFSYL